MKKKWVLLLVTILSLLANIGYCQDYEIPKIQKLEQHKQEYGKPIIYQFPNGVNDLIADYISYLHDTSYYYYIEIKPNDTGYSIILRYSNYPDTNDHVEFLDLLLSSCY